ncbi:YicC family protein [bacterium]|nr:YicC family protein [bacterium]
MIKSMTGFCKSDVTFNNITCNVEVRSVNHRFLELRILLPKQFQSMEELLKRQARQMISRGKVDIYLQLNEQGEQDEKLSIADSVLENLKALIGILEKDIGRKIEINMSDLLHIKGLMIYKQDEKEPELYEKLFSMAVEEGINELIKMRQREGELLNTEIMTHVEKLQSLMQDVPKYVEEVVKNYSQRLKKNLKNLEVKYNPDDPRIMQEIGIFMDRSDITEEIERFNVHLVQMRELLVEDIPVGRKLDFILQELNREVNTLCSKSNHIQITQTGMELKSEIEKIREQIQNIE